MPESPAYRMSHRLLQLISRIVSTTAFPNSSPLLPITWIWKYLAPIVVGRSPAYSISMEYSLLNGSGPAKPRDRRRIGWIDPRRWRWSKSETAPRPASTRNSTSTDPINLGCQRNRIIVGRRPHVPIDIDHLERRNMILRFHPTGLTGCTAVPTLRRDAVRGDPAQRRTARDIACIQRDTAISTS